MEATERNQLAGSEIVQRLEREPLFEKKQRPDHHGVLRRGHVPARGVRARQALGPHGQRENDRTKATTSTTSSGVSWGWSVSAIPKWGIFVDPRPRNIVAV